MDRQGLLHAISNESPRFRREDGAFITMDEHKESKLKEILEEMDNEWASERNTVQSVFSKMLSRVTGDGSKKRQSGAKPPWWNDDSHEPAIFSHLNKWKHGELKDKDSGSHPLVHAAWRCLAIAYQETYGKKDPKDFSVVET